MHTSHHSPCISTFAIQPWNIIFNDTTNTSISLHALGSLTYTGSRLPQSFQCVVIPPTGIHSASSRVQVIFNGVRIHYSYSPVELYDSITFSIHSDQVISIDSKESDHKNITPSPITIHVPDLLHSMIYFRNQGIRFPLQWKVIDQYDIVVDSALIQPNDFLLYTLAHVSSQTYSVQVLSLEAWLNKTGAFWHQDSPWEISLNGSCAFRTNGTFLYSESVEFEVDAPSSKLRVLSQEADSLPRQVSAWDSSSHLWFYFGSAEPALLSYVSRNQYGNVLSGKVFAGLVGEVSSVVGEQVTNGDIYVFDVVYGGTTEGVWEWGSLLEDTWIFSTLYNSSILQKSSANSSFVHRLAFQVFGNNQSVVFLDGFEFKSVGGEEGRVRLSTESMLAIVVGGIVLVALIGVPLAMLSSRSRLRS